MCNLKNYALKAFLNWTWWQNNNKKLFLTLKKTLSNVLEFEIECVIFPPVHSLKKVCNFSFVLNFI